MEECIRVEDWNNLEVYSPDSKCSKCGHDDSGSDYREVKISIGIMIVPRGAISSEELERLRHEWELPGKTVTVYDPDSLPGPIMKRVGVINRECYRCGYKWDERPLDEEVYAQEI